MRRLAQRLLEHLRPLTVEIDELTDEITRRVSTIAPSLLAIGGCGALTAAKIVGETAQAARFRSKDAYAHRQSTTQCGDSPHRFGSSTMPPASARTARTTQKRRRNGSPAHPQTPALRRRVPSHARRPKPPHSPATNRHQSLPAEHRPIATHHQRLQIRDASIVIHTIGAWFPRPQRRRATTGMPWLRRIGYVSFATVGGPSSCPSWDRLRTPSMAPNVFHLRFSCR